MEMNSCFPKMSMKGGWGAERLPKKAGFCDRNRNRPGGSENGSLTCVCNAMHERSQGGDYHNPSSPHAAMIFDCDSRASVELAAAACVGTGPVPPPNFAAERSASGASGASGHFHVGYFLLPTNSGASGATPTTRRGSDAYLISWKRMALLRVLVMVSDQAATSPVVSKNTNERKVGASRLCLPFIHPRAPNLISLRSVRARMRPLKSWKKNVAPPLRRKGIRSCRDVASCEGRRSFIVGLLSR